MKLQEEKVTYGTELEELGLKLSVEWDKLNDFYNIQLYKNNKIITFKLPASSLNLNKAEALIENMDTHIAKSFKLKFFLKVDLEEFAY